MDDEPAVCDGLCRLIGWDSFGFETPSTAHHGQEALRLHHERPFDLIVTDLKMPVLDGIGMIRTLYEEKDPCTMMIVSAYGEFSYAQEAMRYGVRYYLLKPIEETIFSGYLSKIAEDLRRKHTPNAAEQDAALFERQLRVSSVGIIAEIVQYVSEHYPETITLESLAKVYNFSVAYLGRLFKREMGMPFNSYLNGFRIRTAVRYLRFTQYTNNEIALMVGYQDVNYFYKCFKNIAGVTPNEYRRTLKQGETHETSQNRN